MRWLVLGSMGRPPCCDKNVLKRGPWTPEEDRRLIDYINKNNGYGNWRTLPTNAGLQRCGKSCRLRWTNYLRPDIKRGGFSVQEEGMIVHLHSILGNKWSTIAARLPGRTDNEIKNYWNTHIRKKLLRMGIDPVTHTPRLHLLHLSQFLNLSSLSSSSHQMSLTSNPHLVTGFDSTPAQPQSQGYCFTKIKNPNLVPHPCHHVLETLEQDDQLALFTTLSEFDHGQAHQVTGQWPQDNKLVPSYGNLMDDPSSSLDGLTFDQFSSSTSNNFGCFQSSLSSSSSSSKPLYSNSSYYSSSVMDFQIGDFVNRLNTFT